MIGMTPERLAIEGALADADAVRDTITRVHLGGTLDEVEIYNRVSHLYGLLLTVRDAMEGVCDNDEFTLSAPKWYRN